MSEEPLTIRGGLVIPADELLEFASRSSGPGGQHVNKTSTRVTLRWNIRAAEGLADADRDRLLSRLSSRLTREGELVVHADRSRSRTRNREAARARLAELVAEALETQPTRRPTAPSRGARERRLEGKRRTADVKKTRGRPSHDD